MEKSNISYTLELDFMGRFVCFNKTIPTHAVDDTCDKYFCFNLFTNAHILARMYISCWDTKMLLRDKCVAVLSNMRTCFMVESIRLNRSTKALTPLSTQISAPVCYPGGWTVLYAFMRTYGRGRVWERVSRFNKKECLGYHDFGYWTSIGLWRCLEILKGWVISPHWV